MAAEVRVCAAARAGLARAARVERTTREATSSLGERAPPAPALDPSTRLLQLYRLDQSSQLLPHHHANTPRPLDVDVVVVASRCRPQSASIETPSRTSPRRRRVRSVFLLTTRQDPTQLTSGPPSDKQPRRHGRRRRHRPLRRRKDPPPERPLCPRRRVSLAHRHQGPLVELCRHGQDPPVRPPPPPRPPPLALTRSLSLSLLSLPPAATCTSTRAHQPCSRDWGRPSPAQYLHGASLVTTRTPFVPLERFCSCPLRAGPSTFSCTATARPCTPTRSTTARRTRPFTSQQRQRQVRPPALDLLEPRSLIADPAVPARQASQPQQQPTPYGSSRPTCSCDNKSATPPSRRRPPLDDLPLPPPRNRTSKSSRTRSARCPRRPRPCKARPHARRRTRPPCRSCARRACAASTAA